MSPKVRVSIDDKFPYAKRLNKKIGSKNNSEISQITGVNTRTVADYMSGRQRPSADFLAGLASEGYDVHYILTGERTKNINSKLSNSVSEKVEELEARIKELKSQIRDKDEIIALQRDKLESISDNRDTAKTGEEVIDALEQRGNNTSSNGSAG